MSIVPEYEGAIWRWTVCAVKTGADTAADTTDWRLHDERIVREQKQFKNRRNFLWMRQAKWVNDWMPLIFMALVLTLHTSCVESVHPLTAHRALRHCYHPIPFIHSQGTEWFHMVSRVFSQHHASINVMKPMIPRRNIAPEWMNGKTIKAKSKRWSTDRRFQSIYLHYYNGLTQDTDAIIPFHSLRLVISSYSLRLWTRISLQQII